jgi:hypothetical protein
VTGPESVGGHARRAAGVRRGRLIPVETAQTYAGPGRQPRHLATGPAQRVGLRRHPDQDAGDTSLAGRPGAGERRGGRPQPPPRHRPGRPPALPPQRPQATVVALPMSAARAAPPGRVIARSGRVRPRSGSPPRPARARPARQPRLRTSPSHRRRRRRPCPRRSPSAWSIPGPGSATTPVPTAYEPRAWRLPRRRRPDADAGRTAGDWPPPRTTTAHRCGRRWRPTPPWRPRPHRAPATSGRPRRRPPRPGQPRRSPAGRCAAVAGLCPRCPSRHCHDRTLVAIHCPHIDAGDSLRA